MSLDTTRSETTTYLLARLANAISPVVAEVVFENHEVPSDPPYVVVTFVEAEGHNAELSKKLKRYVGYLQADVYVKENTGTKECNTICGAIMDILENKELSLTDDESLIYRVGMAQPMGDDNGKYRKMVRVPYRRDAKT